MNPIINHQKIKNKMDEILSSQKVLSFSNDDSFAFSVYYEYIKNPSTKVIVFENLLKCQNFYNELSLMLKNNVYLYVVDEVTKFTSLATSPEMTSQRIYILNKLIEQEPIIVITHTMAIKHLTPSKDIFIKQSIHLKENDEYKMDTLLFKLVKLGYKNVLKVTQPFEFSTRGGVIDIFSINYEKPIRIEFFDTIVESIRMFDEQTQRTIKTINEVKIIPASEFLIEFLDKGIEEIKNFASIQIQQSQNNLKLNQVVEEDIENLRNYEFNDNLYKYYHFFECDEPFSTYLDFAQVIFVNDEGITQNEMFVMQEFSEQEIQNYDEGLSLINIKHDYSVKEFKEKVLNENYVEVGIENKVNDISFMKIESFDFNLELLYKQLIQLLSEHYDILLGFDSSIHYQSIIQFLNQKNLLFHELDSDNIIKNGINISHTDFNIGLDMLNLKVYIAGEKEIFNKRFKSNVSHFSRYKNAITISSVNEIQEGDYLVHEVYGVGIYKGIETLLNNNIHRDYLKIMYRNDDVLYLPLEQFKLIRKYVSKEGAVPKINKLGSKEWEKTKTRIKERVNELAEKLVSLYSLRVQKAGFEYAKDDELQIAFENDFGYELTKDQKQSLNEIKYDMESPYIMDRILVGDVGFGKTELALRAAFKAINSGKQVALLCPTTLLARQHFLTAQDRFKNFGVQIRLISRLVSDKEINNTLDLLNQGKIDFVIGTHRLLSQDVHFKDLGLLIIDEEHKFGVIHKEKIKELKENVDVLTLSATPIPRTLQMALTGVRGISTINTPIENRMPVQTYVIKKDNRAIKEIIERELARGGQVYYLSNHIERLPNIALELSKMIKTAKIAIAHGKLNVEQTEDIMQRFVNKEYNILLCTTIVENGIDIPNVNTILVDNADCFGLSQLYQIKGRVGRSDRLAYAYLMYNANKQLSDIALKRLQTIKEFTALGSGYKVAMRDLITRGAGDLLGAEQSGFIESIGIDMYIEMLHEAINNRKNNTSEQVNNIIEPKIKFNKMLNIDAYIPQNYFTNDYEKIDLYKRVEMLNTMEELQELKNEMIDKSGKLPLSILMLFEKKQIDLYTQDQVIEKYDEFEKFVNITLANWINKINGVGIKIFEMACQISNLITLKFNGKNIICQIKKEENWIFIMSKFIQELAILKNTK